MTDFDIDKLPPEEILKHLSPDQRREFEEMLSDPTKAASLFALEEDTSTYWWLNGQEPEEEAVQKPGSFPREKLPKAVSTSASLSYNFLAIL